MHHALQRVEEAEGIELGRLPEFVRQRQSPLVLRGLVGNWPIVSAARESARDAAAYLRRFDHGGMSAKAMVAPAENHGLVSYNAEMNGFNFRREEVPLAVVLNTLMKYSDDPDAPMIYVGATTVATYLPGFLEQNPLDFGDREALASVWIGNRSRIPAHQDLPENLACIAAGKRRAILFPPDQLSNLYVGPLDFNPAGQPISLVDFEAPDFERFPRFREALEHAQVAELEPGDALFIPSMWWHHMQATEAFNVLVNYWWRDVPAWMDTPVDALMHAILCMRDLPPEQRRVWQETFRHYVFEPDESVAEHIPPHARGVLAPLDEQRADRLRARLLQRLNR